MKKRLFSILLSICMVFTMIPMAGGAVFAATATSVTIGGNVDLNSSARYYHNATDSTAAYADNNSEGANAEFDAVTGTLTLKGLNVKSNNGGIRWESYNDSTDGYDVNLTIELEDYSDNTVVNTGGSAIVGDRGLNGTGPSLTIKGNGALNLTGSSNGIWVWKNITIEDSAAVNITAGNKGLCNNLVGTTTISDNAYVKINAKKDGIGSDNSGTNNLTVNGGALVISSGNTAVMEGATATVANKSNYSITGNLDAQDGCKYFRVEPNNNIGDKVYIYLRTLDKDSNGSIQVPDDQLEALGIKYYYSYWVDFGSYMSVKTKAYKDANGTSTTERYDETVKAIVNETKAAAIDKKTGITFDRLDAVTWDTLSWSQNETGPDTWHLNGEIPLCKVKFDLNYTGASSDDSLTRYAVKGTDVNTGLPAAPTREGYTFGGWYTEENGGQEIEDIPHALKDDVKYYAHWTPASGTSYSVELNLNDGTFKDGYSNITEYTYGTEVVLPELTKAGYTFEGWYDNDELTGDQIKKITATDTGDKAFWAKWTPIPAVDPKINRQPQDLSFEYGKGGTLEVGAASADDDNYTLEYQWYVNTTASSEGGKSIENATNATYSIPSDTPVGTHYYYCEVTAKRNDNDQGKTVISNVAKVEITKLVGPAAPTDLNSVAASEWGKADGKITGVTADMEYAATKDADKWTACDGTEITGLKAGTYYVRIKATDTREAGAAAEVIVPDGDNLVKSIAVISDSYKKVYYTGEELDVTGLEITVTKSDNTTSTISVTKEMVSGFNSSTAVDEQTLTITYGDKTTTFVIEVKNRTFTGITSESYDAPYDGNAHGITVKGVPEGAQVLYGTSADNCTESKIEYINSTNGEKTVYYKVSMNGYDDFVSSATVNITKKEVTITVSDSSKTEGDADPEFSGSVAGLVEGETLDVKYGRIEADSAKEAAGDDITITATVTNADNYDVKVVQGKLTINKKPSGGHYKPTQKPEIIAGEGTKADLTLNGTKATITVEDGYEITDVIVNGTSLGKVTEITGLKTGDKVEIKTAKKQAEPEFSISSYVKDLKLVARSSKTAKKNIRVKVASVTDGNGNSVDLSELKAKGYTVKYKFYRSEKKAAEYSARLEKNIDNNSYINNTGKKGTKYFYKVRVMVYDANGNLVAKSELKQCRYATRTWSK